MLRISTNKISKLHDDSASGTVMGLMSGDGSALWLPSGQVLRINDDIPGSELRPFAPLKRRPLKTHARIPSEDSSASTVILHRRSDSSTSSSSSSSLTSSSSERVNVHAEYTYYKTERKIARSNSMEDEDATGGGLLSQMKRRTRRQYDERKDMDDLEGIEDVSI